MNRDTARGASRASAANVRQRTLQAAHAILGSAGEAGLNLRAIAAELGTGLGSLYYHFANKEALLAELAADGFRALRRQLEAAARSPGRKTAFHACADAYLAFSRQDAALYALMYSERLRTHHRIVQDAEIEAFEAFRACTRDFGIAEDQRENIALTFWALGRGMASLAADGGARSVMDSKAMSRRVVEGLSALVGEPIKDRRSLDG